MKKCDFVTLNTDAIARFRDRAMVIPVGSVGMVSHVDFPPYTGNHEAQFFANLETWRVTFRKGDGTVKGF